MTTMVKTSTTAAAAGASMTVTTSSSTRPSPSMRISLSTTGLSTTSPQTTVIHALSTLPQTIASAVAPSMEGKISLLQPKQIHDFSKVSPLPPAHLLDFQESEDEGMFGPAHSPSQLRVKCQDSDDEDIEGNDPSSYLAGEFAERGTSVLQKQDSFQERYPYDDREEERHQFREPSMNIPVSLVSELRHFLNDYYRHFPDAKAPQRPLPPQEVPNILPGQSTPKSTREKTLPPPIVITEDTQDAQTEEGEIQTDTDAHDEWDNYIAPMPPCPNPPAADSPRADIGGFHDLLERASKRFDLSMPAKQTECFLYDFKPGTQLSVRAISIIDFLWQEGLKLMKTSASVPAVIPKLDKKYKAPDDSPACLIGHPRPDSVIMQAAQRRAKNPASPCTAPPDKKGRRHDHFGKRFSALAATSIRTSNAMAILGRYDRRTWSDISTLLEYLPEDKQKEANDIFWEVERASSELSEIAMDVSSTAFRQMAGAAVLRRQGWLKATTFHPEVQAKVLDMPFDGECLFGKHIDEKLQSIKKDTDTVKALGNLQQRQFQSFWARSQGNSYPVCNFSSGTSHIRRVPTSHTTDPSSPTPLRLI